jgi:short-subunit dehydrogenase
VHNEWVLITGASSGIGLAFARLFAQNNFNVVLLARNKARLNELSREISNQFAVQTRVLAKDLAQPSTAKEVFVELQREGIHVSILVNNAGFGSGGFFVEEKVEISTSMIHTNITALVELTQLFAPPMIAQKKGKILNVASTAAFQPGPKMSVYYATKAFVFSFSNAIANELDGTGVTVTTLCPGPTRSEFHQRAGTTRSEKTIGKWMMTSEEVARAGYEGAMKEKRIVVPGLVNKVGVTLAKIAPTRVSAAVARKVMEG